MPSNTFYPVIHVQCISTCTCRHLCNIKGFSGPQINLWYASGCCVLIMPISTCTLYIAVNILTLTHNLAELYYNLLHLIFQGFGTF